MNRLFFISITIVSLAILSNKCVAQTANTATASSLASATIVSPIGIKHHGRFHFLTFIKGLGKHAVSSANAKTFSNIALQPRNQGDSPTEPTFTVTGEDSYNYSITFTNASETLTNGTNKVIVSNFIALSSNGEELKGTLSSGTNAVNVGANVTIDDEDSAGMYEGSFQLTVSYN